MPPSTRAADNGALPSLEWPGLHGSRGGQADGDVDPDQSGARERRGNRRDPGCRGRGDQHCLHLVGSEAGSGVEQQRCRTRDHCGGLRGAAAAEQRVGDESFGMFQVDSAERCPQAVDVGSRSGEIWAAGSVATRRPCRHGELVEARRLRGGDGQHPRVDGGGAQTALLAAIVPSRHDDHDAAPPRALDGEGERIRRRTATSSHCCTTG